MFWGGKSDLTDALQTVVNASSDENFCGFAFTCERFLIYGDTYMSTVCWTCIYTYKYAGIFFFVKSLGTLTYHLVGCFFNYWVCLKYLTDWCLVDMIWKLQSLWSFPDVSLVVFQPQETKRILMIIFIYLITSGRFDKKEN